MAERMDAVRVGELLVEIRQHRGDNARVDARRSVVVHVDGWLGAGRHVELNRKRFEDVYGHFTRSGIKIPLAF
jgi:hypothetical protein